MKLTTTILGLVLLGVHTINAVSIHHAKMLRHGKNPGSVEMDVTAVMTLNEDGEPTDESSSSVNMEDTMKAAEMVSESEGPITVDKRFCASVLLAIKNHEAPYWDEEGLEGSGCCSEDRPELLAQCDKKLDGFMKRVSDLCPSLSPIGDTDFKKVEYVEDVEHVETSKHHKRPPKPMPECSDPCADECECCCGAEEKDEPLARTPDGKPVAEWADHPEGPDANVEMKAAAAQELPDCDGKPCHADDFESIAEDLDIKEEAAGGDAGASADEAKEVAEKKEEAKEEAAEEEVEEAKEAEEEVEEEKEEEVEEKEEAAEEEAEEKEEAAEEEAEEKEEEAAEVSES